MYKKYKIADPHQDGPSHSRGIQLITDWTICCLCQTVTPESMQCTSESKRTNVNIGLDEGKGIEATMLEHLSGTNPAKRNLTSQS